MEEQEFETGMRPRLGQTTMSLPVTFDYSGGRRDKLKSARTWAILLEVFGVLVCIATIFKGKGLLIVNLLVGLAILYVITFINRFFILKEGNYRREFLELDRKKGIEDLKEIWGIYSINKNYPYVCRFRNGKSGVIIQLNRDVVLGKYSDAEFEHYEAIADAYNIAGDSKIQMCHIDYMANIGTDERLDDSFIALKDVDNPDIKDLLTDVYTYQKQQMLERLTTYDVYAFMWKGSDIAAWNTIQSILSCFMEANYRSYQVLNENDLRLLPQTIFNLNDFSVINASLNAFDSDNSANVIPISVTHGDGTVEKLGKTASELQEETYISERKAEIIKQEKKSKKSKPISDENSSINWDEEIDL